MTFEILFRTAVAIRAPQGLTALDRARASQPGMLPRSLSNTLFLGEVARDAFRGCSGLSNSTIEDRASLVLEFVRVFVEEDFARRSGHFQNSDHVVVRMPDSVLNGWVDLQLVQLGVMYHWQVAFPVEKLAQEWERAGFPLQWDSCPKQPPSERRRRGRKGAKHAG